VRVTGDWWRESTVDQVPRARWLGIFPRPLRMRETFARKLTIPTIKIFPPHNLGLSEIKHLTTQQCLVLELHLNKPKNLLENQSISTNDGSGTVALAGVLLRDEQITALASRRTTDESRDFKKEIIQTSEPELSLVKRLAYLLQPPTDLLLSVTGPLEWPRPLFEYQMEGIRALLSHKALLLADDMGLGKTVQAIGALRILNLQRLIESSLIIVPAGIISQWRRELRFWAPELRISTVHGPVADRAWQWITPAHVYITSYETFRADFTENPQSPPRRRTWDVVILDEAQKIKNRDVEVSRKCKQLYRRRAWVLTGTPLENRVEDLASILEFVTLLKEGETPLRLSVGPSLRERHQELQLRRKKADVLPHLPPKIISQIMLPLDGSQLQSYERAEKEGIIQLQERGETVRIENVLELILRLKQICNFCPMTGQSAKLQDASERLRTLESEGHRALIFSQFTDEKHGARAIMAKLHWLRPLLYTGDLSPSEKEATIKEFKGNISHKALILSLRAGGQGLNLQDASYVFHFDRWWNPAVERQAEDRAHRLGQTYPVHVYKYLIENTIEERINNILREKQLLFDELVDDVSIDLKSLLSSEELFGLFGLKPPEQAKTRRRSENYPANFTEMSGIEFEEYVKKLLEGKGWKVEATPPTRDGGVDLIARRYDEMGLESLLYVQCKNHAYPVGVDVVRELNGVLPRQSPGTRGVLVCPSGFTADAISFSKDRGIALWDKLYLFELLS
jgi:SNF2 family DNA or RNA helicase